MTRDDVKKLLMVVQSFYPNWKVENKEVTINAWYAVMCERDNKAMQLAAKWYAETDTSGFAPSIGQLLDRYRRLTERAELTGAEAWGMVRDAIGRSTYYANDEFKKLPEPVRRAVGSPGTLKAWAMADESGLGFAQNQFNKTYAAIIKRQKEESIAGSDVQKVLADRNEELEKALAAPENQVFLPGDEQIVFGSPERQDAATRAESRLDQLRKALKGG